MHDEYNKPLDASDLNTLDEAKEEGTFHLNGIECQFNSFARSVQRLRRMLHVHGAKPQARHIIILFGPPGSGMQMRITIL